MKIVVAVDNSNASTVAVKHAVSRAKLLDAEILFVNCVAEKVRIDGDMIRRDTHDDEQRRGDSALKQAAKIAAKQEVPHESKSITHDTVVDGLVKSIESTDPDFVFVGHRELTHNGVGSVARKLIRRSPVPVTVVTNTQEKSLKNAEEVLEKA